MAFSMRTPFMPMFLGEIGVESKDSQAMWSGLVLSVGALMMGVTAPLWGTLADRRGRKLMLLRAQFGAFITIGLSALVMNPEQMLVLRIIEGALAGTVTAAMTLIATSIPKDRLGYGLGMIQTAVFSGAALGPLVGGLIADHVGYRETFGIAAGMMLIAGLITLFIVHETFTRPANAPIVSAEPSRRWTEVLGAVMIVLLLVQLVIRFAEAAVQPITPLYVTDLAGSTDRAGTLAGLTLGILGVTSAISSVIFGRLGDRRGHYTVLVLCTLAAGIMYFPMAAAGVPWQLILFQALFGVFAGGMMPSANALVANHTDENRRGIVFGLTNMTGSIGGFIGPLVGPAVAALAGFRWAFALTGVTLILMGVTLWVMHFWYDIAGPQRPFVDDE